MKSSLLLSMLAVIMISCTPTINYLGDSYGYSSDVDVYYDEGDVPHSFKVMGHMTHDLFVNYDHELIRQEMMNTARLNGADAVIFSEFSTSVNNDGDSRRMVKAQLIKYND